MPVKTQFSRVLNIYLHHILFKLREHPAWIDIILLNINLCCKGTIHTNIKRNSVAWLFNLNKHITYSYQLHIKLPPILNEIHLIYLSLLPRVTIPLLDLIFIYSFIYSFNYSLIYLSTYAIRVGYVINILYDNLITVQQSTPIATIYRWLSARL